MLLTEVEKLLDCSLGIVRRYIMEIIVLMFIGLFALWCFAFIANGLYGYHFDLASCWGGFSAIGGAGFLGAVKYCTDSFKNSPDGKMPGDFVIKQFDKDGDGKVTTEEVKEVLECKFKGVLQ